MRLNLGAVLLAAVLAGSSIPSAAASVAKDKQRPAAQKIKNKSSAKSPASQAPVAKQTTATRSASAQKDSVKTVAPKSTKITKSSASTVKKPPSSSRPARNATQSQTRLAKHAANFSRSDKNSLKTKKSPKRILEQVAEQWQVSQTLAVNSSSALVFDQAAGDTLFQKNASMVAPIASITKLMTAMVVLDSMPDLQAPISIAEDDIDFLRGSRSRLPVGLTISRDTALLLALMSSENRAAHALARHYPGGMPAFITAMNAKARALGMHNSRFADPTGLSSGNVSTAHDLARMVAAAHRYPLIRKWSTTAETAIEVDGQQQVFRNTNPLVNNSDWAVGLSKTGFIHEAGRCLVMQAWLAEKPVVIVLLDSAGKLTRVGDANRIKRWMEYTQNLTQKAPTHASASAGKAG